MPFVFPRHDQLLKSQKELPLKDRQSKVLLEFREAIPRRFVSHFQLIHIPPEFLHGSQAESGFYQARVFQPHRVRRKECPICHQPMDPVGPTVAKCRNPRCFIPDPKTGRPSDTPTSHFEWHSGPVRGVVAVITLTEFVVHREVREAWGHRWVEEKVDRCLLILDRRYEQAALAAVYRAAHQVCELYGWKLK